ncbi:hypothetical protein [Corallococcus exiguus]|uniref:Uncharacterized protein n=1 Tax=Corallococcus exiguus TaxID=83462 RepID=A0A7X5BW65_9BACT|nr:hypothetical protein [Corallococcus exiguus]NBC45929.1 hypothetical protein [Corallococcus exiguus]TNV59601.1 hypothetical protein FH620_26495 [Corallococcus exiguus]
MSSRRTPVRLPHPVRWAMLSTLSLAAPQALAAPCTQPTLTECSNVDYRASSCGQENDSYCQGLMESEWKARYTTASKRTALLPESMGGGVESVAVQPNAVLDTLFSGSDESVVGQVQRGQVLARKGYKNLTKVEQAYDKQRQEWDANGVLERSCQEYVHEKHYDFSRFEQNAGRFGDDFRAVFTAAYGAGGIAERTLFSKDGVKQAPLWDGKTRVEKNAYFRFVPGPYPKGTKGYVFTSEAALKANNAEARQAVLPSDAWHQALSKSLSKVADDVLNDSQQRQEAFAALLERRNAAYASWQRESEMLRSRDFSTVELDEKTAEQLYGLDKALEASLEKADAEGCLVTDKTTACDWSPRRYKAMVDAVMVPRREADLRQCLTVTGNDFGAESFIRNADRLKIKGLDQKDYTLNPTLVAAYSRILAEYLAQQAANQQPPTNPVTMTKRQGQDFSAGGYAGDRNFGGGYSLRAGWELSTPGSAFNGNWCDTNAAIFSELGLYANVFTSTRTEVAYLTGRASTQPSAIRAELSARVLGNPVFTFDQSYPARFTFVERKPFVDKDAAKASATFMVWFIPVTVSGGLSVEVGIVASLGGAMGRDCTRNLITLDLLGNIGPYASANGFVSLAIGIPGLQIGVRGTLTLVRFELPLQGRIGVALSSPTHPTNPNTLFLGLGTSLNFTLRSLDGRLSLFAELGFLKAEFPIVSWPGFGTSAQLFNDQHYLPLAQLY